MQHDFSVAVESIADTIMKLELHHSSCTESYDTYKMERQKLYALDFSASNSSKQEQDHPNNIETFSGLR